MKVLALALLCFSLAAAGPARGRVHKADNLNLSQVDKMFAKFKVDYNRTYASPTEEAVRLGYFRENLAKIARARRAHRNARFGINKFADMSEAEFRTRLNKPLSAAAAVKSCLAGGVSKSAEIDAAVALAGKGAVPATFDWRTKNAVTPVKDQGQCGSCWSFSTTGSIEGATAVKKGTLLSLSEQEIVDCSTACINEPPYGNVCNQGCNGGWPWAAMSDLISWGGSATEAQYPYTGEDGSCGRTASMKASAIRNYTCLSGVPPANGTASEDVMAAYSYANGPLSIALDATPLQFYYSGVVDPSSYNVLDGCSQTELDHAVLLVGWGTYDSDLWGQQPYWLVKNSWGLDWGLSGYFMIYRGANMCGLASAVTYPNV